MSLYLKYRPSDFENLVWQWFVKDTLQKAISENKTVWAYLFCWPRWTGKTSSARIFAKTINCENPINWNPCLKCSVCVNFSEEKLIDIIEIDAASHTWVDNIREIIEKAWFSPTKTKYKIYIIDEVHMLSKWAFNALLKILEEPPKHVKFILATTETHKVPETIISRCQRYDFKRISDIDIKNRLKYIAESEEIKIDDKSIEYIIKNSSWGLRNAISLFEQLISDSEINYTKIVEKLEIVDEDIIESFLNKLLLKDSSVIDILDKNIFDGKNIKLFFKELLFYTKNKALSELKNDNDISSYINILDLLDETYSKTKNSLDENTTFLIWVLKILNWWNMNINSLNSWLLESKKIEPLNKKELVKKEEVNEVEKKEELSHEDLEDVFWDTWLPDSKEKEELLNNWDDLNFDSNSFIWKIKENGWKWWLTMALRWSSFNLNWEELVISVKTKIAKGQIENVDNISLIIKTLSDIWFASPSIKIN